MDRFASVQQGKLCQIERCKDGYYLTPAHETKHTKLLVCVVLSFAGGYLRTALRGGGGDNLFGFQ